MQVSIRTCLVAIIALIAPAMASAEIVVYDQLNVFNQTFNLGPGTTTLSQYDTTVGLPLPRDMATTFDDFTLGSTSVLDKLEWTGAYRGAAGLHATAFQIAFYQDNAGTVGSQIGSTIVAPIGSLAETINGNPGSNHFNYTYTPASSLVFTAGTKYWMSVVAELDFGDFGLPTATSNSWGWAFNSTIGDNNSFQTTQDLDINDNLIYVSNQDAMDHSFRLTTTVVPEPSSCLLLAGAVGGIAVRKWRSRRKQAA